MKAAKKKSGLSRPAARTGKKERPTKLVTTTLEEAIRRVDAGLVPYRHVPDDEIDYSDIPKITDEQWKEFRLATEFRAERRALRRAGRPLLGQEPRKPISIKLDPALIEGLKREAARQGTKYQSLIHRILEDHLAHVRN